MSIEKQSVSKIRKAIQGSAEKLAADEFLKKPEQRHYSYILSFYKIVRALSPELLEKYITITAKDQEMKLEVGAELYEIFTQSWRDATKNIVNELENAERQIKATKKLSPEELEQELKKLEERYIKEKSIQVRNDLRIISAFVGKKDLLEKSLNLSISTSLELLEMGRKNPGYIKL